MDPGSAVLKISLCHARPRVSLDCLQFADSALPPRTTTGGWYGVQAAASLQRVPPSVVPPASVGLGTPTPGPGDLKSLLVQMLFLGTFCSAPASYISSLADMPHRSASLPPKAPSVPLLW